MELFDKIKKGIILLSLCFVCLGQIFAQNVAKIGTTEYASLQAAVDDAYNATYATPTDVTIELTSDITAYTVIKQKADLNLTIDGNNKTYTIYGQIFIDGMGRSSGTETLTITGVNFEGDGTGTGFYSGNNAVFVSIPGLKKSGAPYYRNANNYAHNVTVSNCTFTSTSSSKNIAGFKIENGGGVGYNTTLTNVVGDNLHSLAQINSTDGGGAITNCTATNTKSFVNFAQGQGATPIVISGCTLSSSETESYAVRMKSTSGLNIVLSDNNFTADNVIWLGENDAPSGTINVESGNYNGNIYNGMSASGTGKIVITGGTFSEPKATVDGYCAYGYAAVANDPDDEHCTVRKLEIARIGTTIYPSLQDALDSAHTMTGDVTIELLKNTEEDVTILQKAGLNYIIEGNNDTLNGRIFVDGGRIFPNPVGEVTITNLNFTYNAGLTYSADNRGFVCNSQNNLSYAAHVTVSNCTFDGGDPANSMAAYRDPASAQSWDITLDHLVAKNCHSLVQATSVSGMAITNCNATDNVKNGINISGGGSDHIPGVTNIYTIANDTLACNTDGEYSIRIQEHGRATDTFKLADNMFTAPKAIISKHNTACVIAASSGLYDGDISLESSDAATFSFTGGTFSEPKATVDGYCAYGYAAVANDPDDEHCTVRKLEVARIGTTTYPYLQDALDSARTMTGDVTIELLKNIEGYSIVRQKAGLNLTIEGNNDTIYGQIIIHGDGRLDGAETLTIQNVNFKGDQSNFYSGTDAFIAAPKTTVLPSPFTGLQLLPQYHNKWLFVHQHINKC